MKAARRSAPTPGSTKKSTSEAAPRPAGADDDLEPRPSVPPPNEIDPDAAPDLAPVVGRNLRHLRTSRALSLEKLAQKSGVSRAMLGQIELGQSAPTINVLWKIARALDVTFAALIRARESGGTTTILRGTEAKILTSHDGSFRSRALFPFDGPRRAEFYELRLSPKAEERAVPHPPGTVENLFVAQGALELTIDEEIHQLSTGDAIVFEADVAHVYANTLASDLVMYLVMTYAEPTVG